MDSNKPEGWAPKVFQDFHRSTLFQILVMLLVLSNAIINASFVYKHNASDEKRKRLYYYIEVSYITSLPFWIFKNNTLEFFF